MQEIKATFGAILKFAVLESQMRLLQDTAGLDETQVPSARLDERIHALIRADNRKHRLHGARRVVSRILIFAMLAVTLSAAALAPSEPVRAAVVQTVIEWNDLFAKFVYSGKEGAAAIIPDTLQVTYWPELFTHTREEMWTEGMYYTSREDMRGGTAHVMVTVLRNGDNTLADSEYSEHFAFSFNDHSGWLITYDDGANKLLWNDGEFAYEVYCTASLNETVRIAKSIIL